MAINISKLLSAISAKAVNADSSQSIIELNRLSQAVTLANDVQHARIYSSLASLPTADSSNVGDIVRVGTTLDSDITKYYVSHNDKWKLITLQDSASIYQGPVPYTFQGSNFGYTSGGNPGLNIIDKFSFSSDGNASDVGDLSVGRHGVAGQSSTVSGYTSGHVTGDPAVGTTIDKFPFSSDANATDVGDLTVVKYYHAGQSSSTSGYTSGGSPPPALNVIDKFPFAADANATDVGDLTESRYGVTGQSSTLSGYTSGGYGPPFKTTIDKFPFTSDANATDVGDLTQARYLMAGQSSTDNGYTSGGTGLNPFDSKAFTIDKFPFASDANATDVGDLTVRRYQQAGQSSTASGYTSGGFTPADLNTIDKFPFSSDANASDVGDLTVARSQTAGQQY